jgi:thermostable 8-oxoguanine DNA glycosylase
MKTAQAELEIAKTTPQEQKQYADYMLSIAPRSGEDFFRRWLFAYTSIRTNWRNNMSAYTALKDLEWAGDKNQLSRKLVQARSGMYNRLTDYIWGFNQQYWKNPHQFYGNKGEDWSEYRDRLTTGVKGIGKAKTAFVLEMTWPVHSQVVCLDVHMLRMYGKNVSAGNISDSDYNKIEAHWVKTCKDHGYSPALTRWIVWDRFKGETDSRYWANVFEDENLGMLARLKRAYKGY